MTSQRKNKPLPSSRRSRTGILFVGKQVWISELSSIVFVSLLLVSLLSISFIILKNELSIRKLDRKLAALEVEKIHLSHSMDELREKNRLSSLLCKVVSRKVSVDVIHHLADLVYINSKQFGYSPELLLAVISVESRFNAKALGRYRSGNLSGALGLMQLKYPTALEVANILGMENFEPKDLFDPQINMILGTAYLTRLISQFKSFKLGLLAYNLGPGTVRSTLSKNKKLPMRYYKKVLKQYYKLQGIANRETALNLSGLDCR
ncbi:MAG: lytic transglycosylase domain-containing protein [Chitinispirillaceae bacterium]